MADASLLRQESGGRYHGPIEAGMIFWGPGNDGEVFRRDLILGRHPLKPDLILYEALPCPMRKRQGSGLGEIGVCPEINLRIVMRPEEDRNDAAKHPAGSPYDRKALIDVLIYHWSTSTSACGCGWNELGRSHAEHVADVYEQSMAARQAST